MLKELPCDIKVSVDDKAPIAKAICLYMDFEMQMKESLTAYEYQAYLSFVSTITKQQLKDE